MSIEMIDIKDYSTPAGVESLNVLLAINIQTLWVCQITPQTL